MDGWWIKNAIKACLCWCAPCDASESSDRSYADLSSRTKESGVELRPMDFVAQLPNPTIKETSFESVEVID